MTTLSRQLFKKQFVFDVSQSLAGQSYSRCAQSIQQAGTIHKQAARAVKVKFPTGDFSILTIQSSVDTWLRSREHDFQEVTKRSPNLNIRREIADKGRKNLSGLSKILESVIGPK